MTCCTNWLCRCHIDNWRPRIVCVITPDGCGGDHGRKDGA